MEISERIKNEAEKTRSPEDTVLVWPNLVYIELICMLFATAVLLLLSLVSPAPLEELASADTTPNPTKAPWYFLGLQELLVYFDPWLAGVVLPTMIIVGLIIIPYVDTNPNGKGYYTYSERKFSMLGFSYGLALWYILIVIGVWTRGLDWSWYWPWSDWHVHMSVTAVKLVDLELIFQNMLGLSPDPVLTLGRYAITVSNIMTWICFLGYYAIGFTLPFLLFRNFFNKLGIIRYNLVMLFFLSMNGVMLKMLLRLTFNIKYLVVTPWFKI